MSSSDLTHLLTVAAVLGGRSYLWSETARKCLEGVTFENYEETLTQLLRADARSTVAYVRELVRCLESV